MKTWQRRVGVAVAGTLALCVLAIGGIYGMSASAVGNRNAPEPHAFSAAGGDAIEGARLGSLYGCTDCHGPGLGGTLLIDGMPFARVPAPNLTAGASGGVMSDAAFEQAVRHGIGADGRRMIVMPSSEYTYLSDRDIADILAWVRSLPAVEDDLPARAFGPVGRALAAFGKVPFQPQVIAADPNARHMEKPDGSDPVAVGYYLTRLCTGCHGLDLGGAPAHQPGTPDGADITPSGAIAAWSYADFQRVFATGRRPDGTEVAATMPWKAIGQAQPDELAAIWAYLQTVPPAH